MTRYLRSLMFVVLVGGWLTNESNAQTGTPESHDAAAKAAAYGMHALVSGEAIGEPEDADRRLLRMRDGIEEGEGPGPARAQVGQAVQHRFHDPGRVHGRQHRPVQLGDGGVHVLEGQRGQPGGQ